MPSETERGCWAASLGRCGGGITGEHIISKSQFSSQGVTLQGFSWCKEPKTIGLQSLVANNLCRNHNTALSDADTEALKLLEAIQERVDRTAQTKRAKAPPPHKVVTLDGRRLEQWFLKTTINIALQGTSRDSGLFLDDAVRRELVEVSFGRTYFEPPCGVYGVAEMGENIAAPGGIRFEALNRNVDGGVVGTMFVFHGHRFWLALPGAPEVKGQMQPIRKLLSPNVRFEIEILWDECASS